MDMSWKICMVGRLYKSFGVSRLVPRVHFPSGFSFKLLPDTHFLHLFSSLDVGSKTLAAVTG